jgi:hypothetical protein
VVVAVGATLVLGCADGKVVYEAAWTIEGALRLAEILPERLADLGNALLSAFSTRAAGSPGDAHTNPQSSKRPPG